MPDTAKKIFKVRYLVTEVTPYEALIEAPSAEDAQAFVENNCAFEGGTRYNGMRSLGHWADNPQESRDFHWDFMDAEERTS
ncbi:hypothetical protein EOE18_15400 [Novosphingobium umbonatum]|uniref:Uncharacterized protein n=1 Tax=Novosphingobium umbonatum TaxID=1908524 RepID=A0A3S2USB3_9SPHN|nr:hypothetical protein [Novosphingobium umbonatum]RVU03506.1 hypothetical protein EOE18_15400 [Novosphingobium umbonatum]